MKFSKIFLLFVLIAAANSIELNCFFTAFGAWHFGNRYTCWVTSVDLSTNNNNEVHSITYSSHYTNRTHDDVEGIQFLPFDFWPSTCMSENMNFIPQGITKFFPNLKEITLNLCPVETLDGEQLRGYPKLEFLSIVRSNVSRVPENFIRYASGLRMLSLGSNQIAHVEEGFLRDLPRLEKVGFANNTCIDQEALNSEEMVDLIDNLRKNC